VYLEGALERALSVSIAPRSIAEAPPLAGYSMMQSSERAG